VKAIKLPHLAAALLVYPAGYVWHVEFAYTWPATFALYSFWSAVVVCVLAIVEAFKADMRR
jgi:hypothetical protein